MADYPLNQTGAERSAPGNGNGPGNSQPYVLQVAESGWEWMRKTASEAEAAVSHPALVSHEARVSEWGSHLVGASTWSEIYYYANLILGPRCYQFGIAVGVAGNLTGMVVDLLGLLKMLVLAGMYETIQVPPNQSYLIILSPTEMAQWAAGKALQPLIGKQMRDAYEKERAIVAELGKIMRDPVVFLGSAWGSTKKEYVDKWNYHLNLLKRGGLANMFEAGKIAGDVMAQVILAILAVISGAGLAVEGAEAGVAAVRALTGTARISEELLAKLSTEAPQLLKVAQGLEEAEQAKAAGRVGQVAEEEAKAAEKVAREKPTKPARKNRTPSKNNKNIDQSKTIKNPDGSVTYFDNSGRPVTYNSDGYPDFSPYSEATVKVDGLKGTIPPDDTLANGAVGLQSTPDGYTWHHVEDGQTMQLLPTDIHSAFPHTGGASIIRGNP